MHVRVYVQMSLVDVDVLLVDFFWGGVRLVRGGTNTAEFSLFGFLCRI